MTAYTSKFGVTKDLDLDLDRVMEYEAQHPGWSLFNLMESQAEALRYTDLDLVAKCLGFEGIKAFFAEGFSGADLMSAVRNSQYVGFSDGTEED